MFAIIGGVGMTYGVLMAHARAFLPTALLGRGLTLMNMCLIGGAGLLQPLSGVWMREMTARGIAAADAHAALYGGFAMALTATLVVYLVSRDAKPGV
jgi:hypothetical protein